MLLEEANFRWAMNELMIMNIVKHCDLPLANFILSSTHFYIISSVNDLFFLVQCYGCYMILLINWYIDLRPIYLSFTIYNFLSTNLLTLR